MVDPALLRPGRFDVTIEIGLPDEQQRLAILQVQVRGKPLAKGVDLKALALDTAGLSGADLGAICNRAALNAIRERITQSQGGSPKSAKPVPLLIQARHFHAARKEP